MLAQTGGVIGNVGLGMSGVGALTAPMVLGLYGMGAGSAVLAWDRDKEKEADYIGLMYMSRAGFNPQEAPRVLEALENLEAAEGNAAPQPWESTHPPTPERIQQLVDAMPKALKLLEQSTVQSAPVIVK
jgi:predicted Zn-dependent protease